MEKRLLQAKPVHDTTALLVIIFPLVRWLVSDVPERFTYILELLLLLPALFISLKVFAIPHTPQSDSKPTKRSAKQRTPLLWALAVKWYLNITGDTSNNGGIGKSGSSGTSSSSNASSGVGGSGGVITGGGGSGSTLNLKSSTRLSPVIRFVGSTYTGIALPHLPSLLFSVNNVPWTQVGYCNRTGSYILFGLKPNTIYEVQAVAALGDFIEFCVCTSPFEGSEDDSLKPHRRTDAHAEALQSISDVLAEEKARVRKYRKDCLKRLSGMRQEIDSLKTKLATKRKADERARKRIQALRDRVAQQKVELADLEAQGMTLPTASDEVNKLSLHFEEIQREQVSKQQGLDVSTRVWDELQRSKRSEVKRLNQRYAKLADRLEKARADIANHNQAQADAVAECIRHLRNERNTRKQRRVRLEADFRSAIAKLAAV